MQDHRSSDYRFTPENRFTPDRRFTPDKITQDTEILGLLLQKNQSKIKEQTKKLFFMSEYSVTKTMKTMKTQQLNSAREIPLITGRSVQQMFFVKKNSSPYNFNFNDTTKIGNQNSNLTSKKKLTNPYLLDGCNEGSISRISLFSTKVNNTNKVQSIQKSFHEKLDISPIKSLSIQVEDCTFKDSINKLCFEKCQSEKQNQTLQNKFTSYQNGGELRKLDVQIKQLQIEKEIMLREQSERLQIYKMENDLMKQKLENQLLVQAQEIESLIKEIITLKDSWSQSQKLEETFKQQVKDVAAQNIILQEQKSYLKVVEDFISHLFDEQQVHKNNLVKLRIEMNKLVNVFQYLLTNQDPPLNLLISPQKIEKYNDKDKIIVANNLHNCLRTQVECENLLKLSQEDIQEIFGQTVKKFISDVGTNLIQFRYN